MGKLNRTLSGVQVFALIWFAVLLLPPLRRQAWRQVVPDVPSIFTPASGWERPELALEPYSPDVTMCLQAESDERSRQAIAARSLAPMLVLADQHRGTLWLQADVLRISTRIRILVAIDPQSDDFPWGSAQPTPTWFNPKVLGKLIHIARASARDQPDNAYFPLMEAWLCFGAEDENGGWDDLARASHCSRFDDFRMAAARRRTLILDRFRRVGWMEMREIIGQAGFPSVAVGLRHLCPCLLFRARQARAGGDFKSALRQYEAALALGRALRKSRGAFLDVVMGEDIEARAWSGALGIKEDPDSEKSLAYRNQNRLRNALAYTKLAQSWGASPAEAQASVQDARAFLTRRLDGQIRSLQWPSPLWRYLSAIFDGYPAAGLASLAWVSAVFWVVTRPVGHFGRTSPAKGLVNDWTTVAAISCLLAGTGVLLCLGCQGLDEFEDIQNGAGFMQRLSPERFVGELAAISLQSLLFLWPLVVTTWIWRPRFVGVKAGIARMRTNVGFRVLARRYAWIVVLALILDVDTILVDDAWRVYPQMSWQLFVFIGPVVAASAFAALIVDAFGWRSRMGALVRKHWRGFRTSCPNQIATIGDVAGRMAVVSSITYVCCALVWWPFNAAVLNRYRDIENRGEVTVGLDEAKTGP